MNHDANEKTNAIRTSIYIDEGLIKKAEILYGEADVTTFSQFVRKAVESYIDQLLLGNHSPELTKSIHGTEWKEAARPSGRAASP